MSNRIEDLIEKARHYENLWHEALDDNKRLKIEADLLEGRVRYWRIEAECDHGRWLRCLEDLDNLRKNADISPSQSPHEVAQLKAEVERLDTLCKQLGKQHSDISCENIMLRKAGDAMSDDIETASENGNMPHRCLSVIAWHDAKEGKPSA